MKKIRYVFIVIFFFLIGCSNNAQYGEELKSVADDILETSVKSEEVTQGYSDIWSFSIKSGTAVVIEEVMAVTGLDESTIREHFVINEADNVPGDFSLNISGLNSYYQSNGVLEEIEEKSLEIKERVTELNSPPKDYEPAYEELLNMYTYSEEYARLAIDPEGSLQSFNEKRSQLSSEIMNTYQRIEVLIPAE